MIARSRNPTKLSILWIWGKSSSGARRLSCRSSGPLSSFLPPGWYIRRALAGSGDLIGLGRYKFYVPQGYQHRCRVILMRDGISLDFWEADEAAVPGVGAGIPLWYHPILTSRARFNWIVAYFRLFLISDFRFYLIQTSQIGVLIFGIWYIKSQHSVCDPWFNYHSQYVTTTTL